MFGINNRFGGDIKRFIEIVKGDGI